MLKHNGLAVLAILSLACSDPMAPEPPVDLSGTWTAGINGAELTVVLAHDTRSGELTGLGTIEAPGSYAPFRMHGVFADPDVRLEIVVVEGRPPIHFVGYYAADDTLAQMFGTLNGTGGFHDHTFVMERQ